MYRLLFFGLCITLHFPYSSDALRVGSFNLEHFGPIKIKDVDIMSSIVKILRRYDVVLIMGLRDTDGNVITKLQVKLNKSGSQWNYKKSKRVGPVGNKDQYAFYYRAKYLTAESVYQFDDGTDDGDDTFLREPFGVLFNSSKTGDLKQFGLLGVRVHNDDAVKENNALSDVLDKAMTSWNVDDVMLLGDLKADCNHVKAEELANLTLKQDDSYIWLIGDDVDTTRSNGTDCAYDRIIVHGMLLKSETDAATAKAYRFDKELDLNTTVAKKISNHYPVEVVIHSDGEDVVEGSAAVDGTTVAGNTVNGDGEDNGGNENSKNGLKTGKVIGGTEEKGKDDNRNKAARNTGFALSGCIIFVLRYFVI